MQNSNGRWKEGAFAPINTLNNPPDPNIAYPDLSRISSTSPNAPIRKPLKTMQNEQDPVGSPRSQQSPADDTSELSNASQPEFGKPSPLRNKLKKDKSIFNVPDPRKPRPEHHRPAMSSKSSYSSQHAPSRTGTGLSQSSSNSQWPQSGLRMSPQHASAAAVLTDDFFEETRSSAQPSIPARPQFVVPNFFQSNQQPPRPAFQIQKPYNIPHPDVPAASRPVFSSNSAGFKPIGMQMNPAQKSKNTANPAKNDDDEDEDEEDEGEDNEFDANKAFQESKFGDYDPLTYVDATQAQEDIRALLEGAIDEDEDDKPRARLRRQRSQKAPQHTSLAEKLEALEVSSKKGPEVAEDEEVDDGSVEGLKVKLLPHQIDGVAWMLDKEIGERKKNGVLPNGGILADDMGLGKTIQALSLILSNPKPENIAESAIGQKGKKKRKIPSDVTGTTLVVAPLALIKQWESEIKTKVLPSRKLKVLVHHGPSRKKRGEDLKKYDIVITTYQTVSSEHDNSPVGDDKPKIGCMGVRWWRIILDEAHSIKNRNAKMTKAAYALRSVYRWCLTGTPMQNNLDELQSLIRFLRIKPYADIGKWRDHIGGPMKNGRGGIAMKRLQYFLKSFMKRRTKDVLKQEGALDFGKGQKADDKGDKPGFKIVARDVKTIVVEFTEQERDVYQKFEERTGKSLQDMMGGAKQDYIGALVLLLRLRQLCNHRNLMKGSVHPEKDTYGPSRSKTHKLGQNMATDIDDVAALMGDLTVESKHCDICRTKLYKDNTARGGVLCSDCANDLKGAETQANMNDETPSKSDKSKRKVTPKKRMQGRRIIESEDEDEDEGEGEGEWLVEEDERSMQGLGKAGGTDDENAEGEGESLGVEDSDTDEEEEEEEDGDDDSNDESEDEREIPIKRRAGLGSRHETADKPPNDSDDESAQEAPEEMLPPKYSTLFPSSKISRLIELLEEESDKHKFIVFSEFTSMLDIVEPFLLNAGFRFTRYDGSMRNDEREASLERLRNDKKTRILLCSLRCGSLGLNLTAASRVVILEPFWNPFVEEQAIDRVHRLNQTQDVVVYRFTIASTVEERILQLQEKKRELAKAAIDGGSQAVGKLTMKDILKLFKQDAENSEDSVLFLGENKGASGVLGGTARGPYKQPRAADAGTNSSIYGRRWY